MGILGSNPRWKAMEYQGRTLDRIPQFDERSRGFAAVGPEDKRSFKSRVWECPAYLDQGREGACVGFAWAHELAAKPKPVDVSTEDALAIYREAQKIDEWAGEDYSGTSVLAGIKSVMTRKNAKGNSLIREYRWAFGVEDVLRVISYAGPVVLGIEWQESFYTPDTNGQIWLSDKVVGGHAILANGVDIVPVDGVESPVSLEDIDVHASKVRLHNSWGTDYGIGGDCFISVYDLNHLLSKGGEACIPFRRSRG